ncbi:hypothetical protein J2T57_003293 [Natronocella acetinitrilica]|uniref:TonB-dependent receptor n=1 Tax=Natronocella acetinitrilica TaxID=414046 RepID=A0AAE3G5Q8_9GAMM|nr:hypothetical protein [Natronocella acetinitrilica]MCP1676134.1 hypothetical protein [Natronocella acetinitrilica]
MRHLITMFLAIGLLLGAGPAMGSNHVSGGTVYEVHVRGLPPAGRAWTQTRPVQDLPRITLQNIDMDRSVLVVRSRGLFSRSALERAVEESGLQLLYIEERQN